MRIYIYNTKYKTKCTKTRHTYLPVLYACFRTMIFLIVWFQVTNTRKVDIQLLCHWSYFPIRH